MPLTAFTYEPRSPEEHLFQGDVLEPTEALRATLHEVHPHFEDPHDYPLFMVLTQTCDLVERDGHCKSHYITLCAVRPRLRALDRLVGQYQRSKTLSDLRVIGTELRPTVRDLVERFMNNNQPGYFYLHPDFDKISEPMCAFLPVSIALRAAEHYGTCRQARLIGLKAEFRAKLGWLVGELYSRVDTVDWHEEQPQLAEGEFSRYVDEIIDQRYAFVEDEKLKRVRTWAKSQEAPSLAAILEHASTVEGKGDKLLSAIGKVLQNDPGFRGDRARVTELLGMIKADPQVQRSIQQIIAGRRLTDGEAEAVARLTPTDAPD